MNLESALSELYGKDELDAQLHRYHELVGWYHKMFDRHGLHFFSTPGRTEMGGNHTDHNHGRVLAASINLDSIAVAATNGSNQVHIFSKGYTAPFVISLDELNVKEEENGTTSALIRGIASRLKELGHRIGGFNACITSDVLPGSGLSSSASIEVLIGTMFNTFFNHGTIGSDTIAIIGQYAENHFFGKPCGLMDQVACATGGIVTIDFRDPQIPVIKKVDFDFVVQGYRLIVVDTGGTHADLTDDYSSIPEEMKSVARELGSDVCRGINLKELTGQIRNLRSRTGDRALLRAFHFLGDNQRVADQVEALERAEFDRFLDLVNESGNSSYKYLQNIYSTGNPEEQGVALALMITESHIRETGAGACRVHGGGFAGTVQVYLPADSVGAYREKMEAIFGQGSVHILRIRSQGTTHLYSE
jgi:galactokinase